MMTPEALEREPRFEAAVDGALRRGHAGLGGDRPRPAPGRMGGVDGPGRARAPGRRPGRVGGRRDPRPASTLELRGRVPAPRDRPPCRRPRDRPHPRSHRGHLPGVRRRLRHRPGRGRRAHRRRHVPRQRDGRTGRRPRVVPRPVRRRDGRRGARRVQGMADARALRLDRPRLAAPVRPTAGAPRRPAKRGRRPRRRRADGRAAPLGHPRRRARRGQDGARACGARPDPGRHGLRGDRVAGHRRPGLHRGARRPRQAARGRDARPEARSGCCPSSRRRCSPASTHRSPQGLLDALLPARRVRLDDAARRGDADRASTSSGRPDRGSCRRSTSSASARSTRTTRSPSPATRSSTTASTSTTDDETLTRAYDFAQQFLPGVAPPGGLLRLVNATALEAHERSEAEFDGGDVLATLAAASGLPLAMLDAAAPLRLEDVRAFFEERILQQPDAVTCVVERIAMVKAGLTDPSRPLGVFLFLGPTGTGKTEIAKALAEFLFGSPDRLVRLDMSEFQSPESLERLLSDTTIDSRGAGLISAVRSDPFSVVLLDEFEKAAAPVWDVFLQVFDDGRLTDTHGQLVDFRRCVIVLTSNVGSSIAAGSGVGFEPSAGGYQPDARGARPPGDLPAGVPEPARPRRDVPAVRAGVDALASRQGAGGGARAPRPPRAAVGRRGRRVGVRLPDRQGVQPDARCAPAPAGHRAARARSGRGGDRRADRGGGGPVPLRQRAARRPHRGGVRRSRRRRRRRPGGAAEPARPPRARRAWVGGTSGRCSTCCPRRDASARPSARSRPRRPAPSRRSESRRSGRRTAGSTCSPRPSTSIGSRRR